jgi:hypothetical protein
MDGWDVALLVAAGYVAVSALVRLMIRRRDQAVGEFRAQLVKEQRHREAEQKNQRKQTA